jgi:eukaryotic-like serine/threonine-protein kinase
MGPEARIGRYRIVGVIGPWRLGWIYRGRGDFADGDGRDAWLKTLSPVATRHVPLHRRFENEARITAAFRHPNIIATYELGEHEGAPFIAFEALEGLHLRDAIRIGVSLKFGIPVALQVLDALAFLHERGVIHRNIQPAGVFLRADGHAKIVDFWLAKQVDPGAGGAPTAPGTRTARLWGAPPYLSPELVRGQACDPSTDLYSVGCVLYELVTGSAPFRADSPHDAGYAILHHNPDLTPVPNGPEWQRLRLVIVRALQKKPEDRYRDAATMRQDLAQALGALGGSADWTAPPSSRGADGA